MLEIQNLSKVYDPATSVRAVNDANLRIADGEFFALLGPSGCGKTTLLRMLAGFETPTEGKIFLGGTRIDTLPANQRSMNLVFQRYALFPHLTVRQNVEFGLKMKKLPANEIRSRADEMLALVRMQGFDSRPVTQLSGGQQQRVALARALVNRPKVILLDEPLSALDLQLRQQMQVELKSIQRRSGHTFILVTHDQEEALTLSDRIAVMHDGVIQQIGTPQAIYEKPESPFVATFIGSVNTLVGKVVKSGGSASVSLSDAVGFTLPADEEATRFPDGTPVNVYLRPEKIHLGEVVSAGSVHFSGKVKASLYQGAFTRYVIESDRLPGASITVAQAYSAKVGDEVQLSWSPGDCRVMAI